MEPGSRKIVAIWDLVPTLKLGVGYQARKSRRADGAVGRPLCNFLYLRVPHLVMVPHHSTRFSVKPSSGTTCISSSSCVTTGQSLPIIGPQLPHLQNENINSNWAVGGLNEGTDVKVPAT